MSFIINSYNFAAAAPSFSYVLDDYPTGAAAGYSIRKLRSGYSGNCVRIRRSSDNTLQDIGFVDNYIDTAAIASFAGAGDAYVETWYDQLEAGGTSRDMTNTSVTNNNQPWIYSGGSLLTVNSKAALRFFDGVNSSKLNYLGVISTGTTSQVFAAVSTSDNRVLFYPKNSNVGTYIFDYESGSTSTSIRANVGTPSYFKNNEAAFTGTTRGQLYTYFNTNGPVIWSITNVNFTTMSAPTANNFLFQEGLIGLNGFMQEVLIYQTGTETRSNIVTNINNYYSIF